MKSLIIALILLIAVIIFAFAMMFAVAIGIIMAYEYMRKSGKPTNKTE